MDYSNKIIFTVDNQRAGYTVTLKDTEASFYGILFGLRVASDIIVTVDDKPVTYKDFKDKYKDTDIKSKSAYKKGVITGRKMIDEL